MHVYKIDLYIISRKYIDYIKIEKKIIPIVLF